MLRRSHWGNCICDNNRRTDDDDARSVDRSSINLGGRAVQVAFPISPISPSVAPIEVVRPSVGRNGEISPSCSENAPENRPNNVTERSEEDSRRRQSHIFLGRSSGSVCVVRRNAKGWSLAGHFQVTIESWRRESAFAAAPS